MGGRDKFKEVAQKIKDEVQGEKLETEIEKQEAIASLAKVQADTELAQLYQDNAKLGADNLAGELPLLKVHATGRSSKNELSDGTEPNNGWFYYKPTKEQFETLECHILTISRGYRAPGMEEKGMVFNQIVGGVIIAEEEFKPFLLYISGSKLQNLWDFGKEASVYTRGKPLAIPMFALRVKLSTEEFSHEYGKSWKIRFDTMKDELGFPVVVTDKIMFGYLKDHVEQVEGTIENIITNSKGNESKIKEELPEEPDGIPF